MNGFGGEDGASNGEVILAHDGRGGAEVGAAANTLEDGGERDEALGVSVGELVGAGGDGHGASSCEALSKDVDVLLLVVRNVLEVVVVVLGEAGGCEVRLGHLVQAFDVEDVLEVLKGESKLEDVGVGIGLALDGGCRNGGAGQGRNGGKSVLHVDDFRVCSFDGENCC